MYSLVHLQSKIVLIHWRSYDIGSSCVASYVGGVSDMLRQNEEGFIYQADAPYMMAYYICEILEMKNWLEIF